jgi:hypothetical protein
MRNINFKEIVGRILILARFLDDFQKKYWAKSKRGKSITVGCKLPEKSGFSVFVPYVCCLLE